jgi:hypothetical protein
MKKLETLPEYQQILGIIEKMDVAGLLDRLSGQCIAACDLVQHFLYQVGIESKIVEVQLSVSNPSSETPNVPDFMFIGFDGMNYPGQIDTHVVVITKTEIPFLIDLSIAYTLPQGHRFVFRPVETVIKNDLRILAEFDIKGSKYSYQEKKSSKYPTLHQKTILEKLIEDQKMSKNFKIISYIAILSLIITLINMGLNSGLLYLKFMLG